MTEREWLNELAADLGIPLQEIGAVIALMLMHNGRADLVAAIVAGKMTVREALRKFARRD